MDLSMTSDYVSTSGCPEPFLRRIAESGFTRVHWCHQWSTDFLYSGSEIRQIGKWLSDFGLELLDLHASTGTEKCWSSPREYERLAGLELVVNRMEMAASLSSDVIIMHIPKIREDDTESERRQAQVRKSLNSLEPVGARLGVRIAIENDSADDFERIRSLFSEYSPKFLGLCYDSGHGNIGGAGLDHLDSLKDRLISVHLHDNDGSGDQHNLLMSGTVEWDRLVKIMARSAYSRCMSQECNMRGLEMEEDHFLGRAFRTGAAFSEMVEAERQCVA